jgi:hypothetical protein
MSDDWEYSEDECPKCGSQLASRRCDELGCENGEIEDDDGLGWVDIDKCDACNGKGYQEWCRTCGWDMTYGQFLSPQHEAEWLAKQREQGR